MVYDIWSPENSTEDVNKAENEEIFVPCRLQYIYISQAGGDVQVIVHYLCDNSVYAQTLHTILTCVKSKRTQKHKTESV